MTPDALIKQTVNTYLKHGWQLRKVLLRGETYKALRQESKSDAPGFDAELISDASIDALWFSRPSHERREAWELRLLAENPFALFETFEEDETEEQRDELRAEMEARLRDQVNK